MARTVKDKVVVKTIREWASITGFTDDEILKWTVKELREKLKRAHTDPGPYWRVFLKRLRKNLEDAMLEALERAGLSGYEVEVLEWPQALADPTSSAADQELDEVADQIRVAIS